MRPVPAARPSVSLASPGACACRSVWTQEAGLARLLEKQHPWLCLAPPEQILSGRGMTAQQHYRALQGSSSSNCTTCTLCRSPAGRSGDGLARAHISDQRCAESCMCCAGHLREPSPSCVPAAMVATMAAIGGLAMPKALSRDGYTGGRAIKARSEGPSGQMARETHRESCLQGGAQA